MNLCLYHSHISPCVAYCVSVVVEAETEVLEEEVFQEEVMPCFLSPLQAESIDFPDTPVSSRFIHIEHVLHCSVDCV